jgi:hypothetical protein
MNSARPQNVLPASSLSALYAPLSVRTVLKKRSQPNRDSSATHCFSHGSPSPVEAIPCL